MAALRTTFARILRETRSTLDITQREIAVAVGVSRAHIAAIEAGRANPSLGLVDRISERLQLGLDFVMQAPATATPRQRDLVHAWCLGYVARRLTAAGLAVRREVEVVTGRSHGWIDLLAFDPASATLFVIEIKTRLDDLGDIERQVGWYSREARSIAARFGWQPRIVATWVLFLASDEVDVALRLDRDGLRMALPVRAEAMRRMLAGVSVERGRGMALIDPASRRRDWLLRSAIDGRRSAAPYRDYADAARRRTAQARGRAAAARRSA
jgi:transcriptional regulator with XRE-family HTH domain